MTEELRLERVFDAPPEVVWDVFNDPGLQEEIHGSAQPDWIVHSAETDVRVGGTSTYVMGAEGKEPDTETRVYSVVDRPHRLVFTHVMEIGEWNRTLETEMTLTFEERDGKTLLVMVQTGFETAEDRDSYMEGWPEYLDTLDRVVGDQIKARHESGD